MILELEVTLMIITARTTRSSRIMPILNIANGIILFNIKFIVNKVDEFIIGFGYEDIDP